MVALSGEPGQTVTTDGFIMDESTILRTLTGYLGTGTTFGVHRFRDTFGGLPAAARPIHILIITDNDIFSMLDRVDRGQSGWQIAEQALVQSRGGGTYVLQLPERLLNTSFGTEAHGHCQRMERDGWHVALVNSMEQLLDFARRFSQMKYGK